MPAPATNRVAVPRASRASKDGRMSRDRRPSTAGRQSLGDGPELDPVEDEKARARAEATKDQRRGKAMKNFALNSSLSDSLSSIGNLLVHGIAEDATAAEKMQKVMISAKERGLTIPQIFKIFLGKGPDDDLDEEDLEREVRARTTRAAPPAFAPPRPPPHPPPRRAPRLSTRDPSCPPPRFAARKLPPAEFEGALQMLGPQLFRVEKQEMSDLVRSFDSDGNGTISLIEFRDWCYKIPHLAWRAEKLRFERGEDGFTAPSPGGKSPKPAGGGGSSSTVRRRKSQSISTTAGEGGVTGWAGPTKLAQIYHGTKMFWHSREKLEIDIAESKPYSTLVVMTYNETAKKALPPLYVDLNVASEQLDAKNVEVMVERAAEKEEKDKRRRLTPAEKLEIARRIEGESLANFVLVRLKLEAGVAAIYPLASDAASADLVTRNPGLPLNELYRFEEREEVNFGAGSQQLAEIEAMRDGIAKSTKEAGKAQRLLEISIQAFASMSSDTAKLASFSGAKRKLYLGLKRTIIREQIKATQKRIAHSATYHALLSEQAAKGNTESAALLKTLQSAPAL